MKQMKFKKLFVVTALALSSLPAQAQLMYGNSFPFWDVRGPLTTQTLAVSGNSTFAGNVAVTGTITITGTQTFTGVTTFTAAPVMSALTASQAVFTNGSKALVSNAITGTGNVVMSASPTLTGTIIAAGANLSGGIKQTGAVAARFENTFGSVPAGSTGSGVELGNIAGVATIVSGYDRTGSVFYPLKIQGLTVALTDGTNQFLTMTAAGNINILSGALGFGSASAPDVILNRVAANTLGLYNSTNPQSFQVYNTRTDASNFERLDVKWQSNVATIGIGVAGSGDASRALSITTGTGTISLLTTGSAGWTVAGATSHYVPTANNTLDIGLTGTRPRTIYAGTSVIAPTVTTSTDVAFMGTSVALVDYAAAQAGTLTNAPAAGNPVKWIGINDNGTVRKIPTW